MGEPEADIFLDAFAVVMEGHCPLDGHALQRREGWGHAFCPECRHGWLALMDEVEVINQLTPDHRYFVWMARGGSDATARCAHGQKLEDRHVGFWPYPPLGLPHGRPRKRWRATPLDRGAPGWPGAPR